MKVTRLRVSGMWSFGAEPVEFADFAQHNVLIGKNNAGKSRVLRAIEWVSQQQQHLLDGKPVGLPSQVRHKPAKGTPPSDPFLFMEVEPDPSIIRGACAKLPQLLDRKAGPDVEICARISKDLRPGRLWVTVRPQSDSQVGAIAELSVPEEGIETRLGIEDQKEKGAWRSAKLHVRNELITAFCKRVKYVGGWRSLGDPVESNEPIVKRLTLWRSPPTEQDSLRDKYNTFQALYRELVRNAGVEVVPDASGTNFALDIDGRYLPLSVMGDGLQQFVMIAFHLAADPECLLLIEEPETHLHPELQRNLMRVLYRELRGQSITTTHSPVMLDASLGARVFRVEHAGDQSRSICCLTPADLRHVLNVLDVRPSDLLQANLVIWVEGPTDRMFLKHALDLHTDRRLIEGVDYQFAYYGGANRAHVTLNDELTDEFINLLKLCRHVVMVCDSDRAADGEPLNDSKERLRQECEAAGGLYWVTDGREIENYLPEAVLTKAYQELMGDRAVLVSLSQFAKLSGVLTKQFPNPKHGDGWKVKYEDNKARVMPELLKHLTAADLSQWTLRDRLEALVGRIRAANPK